MFLIRAIIRILALVNKEVLEVVRQPGLVLALVFGPFVILFVFGIGHKSQQPPLVTELVIPPGLELPRDVNYWRNRFGGSIVVVAVTENEQSAIDALKAGQLDLAVVVPSDSLTNFVAGKQSTIQVLDNQIDPTNHEYVSFIGYVLASELNRQVIAQAAQSLQQDVKRSQQPAGALHQDVNNAQASLKAGNTAAAQQQIGAARGAAAAMQLQLQITQQFVASSGTLNGTTASQQLNGLRQAQDRLNAVSADLDQANAEVSRNPTQASADLAKAQGDLAQLDPLANLIDSIPPDVLAAPFTSTTQTLASIKPDFVAFYSPSVLALLLQHLAITIAALSLVRERLLGTIELYQVSPVSTAGLLIGKYLSYAVLCAAVAGALAVLMIRGLAVPFNGDPGMFVAVLALLVFASLGVGLALSLLSTSQENAVQLAMLVLLASVFFSGFFLPLNTLQGPASWISDVLPVTYAIIALQDVMLRGGLEHFNALVSMGIIGIVAFLFSALLLHRELRRR